MKKALKILKIIGITLGVIIILLIVVPFFIPADTYKKLIVEQAEKQISGKIEIGSMRLRILPWPGFILRDIKVSNNADTFKEQAIVAAGKIAIDLQLRPLLDKMVVASLELIKPEVYFRTAKDGHTNIDDLLKKPPPSEQAPSATLTNYPTSNVLRPTSYVPNPTSYVLRPTLISTAWADDAEKPVEPSTEGPKSSLATGWQPMLGGFIIDDALLEMWEEGQEKPTQQIKHLDLEIEEFSPLKEEAKTKFSFAAAVLEQEAQNVFIKGGLTLRMEKQEAEVNNWVITIGKADFNLNASAEYGKQPPAFKATLVGTSFTLDELLAFDPSQKKNLPPNVKLDGPMSLNVDVAGTPESVSLNTNVSLTSAGVAYADMFTKPKGTAMKLDLKGHYTPAKVTIKPLTLTLGETVFNIDGYANMDAAKNGELAIDTKAIKIGELATMTPMLATATGVSDPSIHIDIKGPFTDPTKLNISGHVASKKIIYAEYEMDNLDTKFSYADNKANLDSLTAIIYEGNLDGKAQVILTDEPQYSSDVLINKVNLSKIKAIEGLIVGKGSVKVDITGRGADPEVAKKNLNGQGYIHLEEG